MSRITRATQAAAQAGVAFTVHEYDYDPDAPRIGAQAAAALGVPAGQVLKTLMALADGKPVCVLVPSDAEVSMKKLARAANARSAQMMAPTDAERVTGFRIGGVSPFGQRRVALTLMEETALRHDQVFINAGRRGLQLRLSPGDALAALQGAAAALIA